MIWRILRIAVDSVFSKYLLVSPTLSKRFEGFSARTEAEKESPTEQLQFPANRQ